jgi:predicted DCC family thiol-disulfide oxidoreductase YuxK
VKTSSISYPLTIYYDASCPLCAEEMHALKRHDAFGRLCLVDCSPQDFEDAHARQANVSRSSMMRRIHARDAAGVWLDGVPVFAAAYRAAGIEMIASLWGLPRMQSLWDRAYMWVASNRMWLSRLGANKLYGWLVEVAARRAEHRAKSCVGRDGCRANDSLD